MEFQITFDPDAATLATAGEASLEGFRRGIKALVDDPRFEPGMAILVDHRSLDVTPLDPSDVRAIGEYTATLGERIGPSSVAVVVPDRVTFGFVRMGESFANQPQLSVRVFYSLPEGVEWLRTQTPASGTP